MRSVQRQDAQAAREAPALARPVGKNARRRDDQRRVPQTPRALLDEDMRERLHRLSEPHIVGQDAAEVVRSQELQPVETGLLIGAQRRRKAARNADFGQTGELAQRPRQRSQSFAAPPLQMKRLLEIVQMRGLRERDRQSPVSRERVGIVEFYQRRQHDL